MVVLLAIETATAVCSVALLEDDRVTVLLSLERPRAHSENLVPMVADALRLGGAAPADVDAVAVSMGPGSYTGLRIGVSTAKGLASSIDAQLVGVPSLQALANDARLQAVAGDTICSAFRSRRDDVFAAAYYVSDDAKLVSARQTAALAPDDIADWMPTSRGGTLWLAGEGAGRLAGGLTEADRARARVLPADQVRPSAEQVGRIGLQRLNAGTTEDVGSFEPYYLKEFVAKKPKRNIFQDLRF